MGLCPVGSPYNITRMQCFGYIHTGVLWVLCMFFDHRIARYRKGFRKVHLWALYGFLWISYALGNRIIYEGINGLGISVWSVVPERTGPNEAREVTFVQYLPGQAWLCAIWPEGASTLPLEGLQAYRHKIIGRPYVYKNMVPIRVQTSSKHGASLWHAAWLPTGPRTARELHVT